MLGDALAYRIGHPRTAANPRRLAAGALSGAGGPQRGVFHALRRFAVFVARFVPPIRAFVPVTAGALGLPPPRFFAVNIPAILLWAPAHVLPGVLAGHELEKAGGLRLHHGLPVAAGIAALLVLATWAIRRRRRSAAQPSAQG